MISRMTVATLIAVLITMIPFCLPVTAADKLNVVASTTLLQSAVKDIGGRYVSVSVLIAPGSCPGHYDIRPQDIRRLSSSRLVLTHGYECFVDNIVRSMGRNRPDLVKITASGNWMVPSVYFRGAKQAAEALCKADPKHSNDYRKSLSSLETSTNRLAAQLIKQSSAKDTSRIAVLCSDQQEAFVKWMGFKIVGTYARAEEFTPTELHKLTANARRLHVQLVIDNLQSGPTAGMELAKDVGAAHVTLSSFPGGFAGTDTWSKCIQDNVNRVIRGIGKR